ncbi:hypothetical protein [Aureimonas sp. AU40]|uniref:hypothetical protein n=1 Tax=Aureimonas sp. AU40 TaxID=1637747 RepID=UPI000781E49B|nr:hypothetical protein [Aureimonas sp. AU40]
MNAHNFCRGFEGAIFSMVSASMAARQTDTGGQEAVDLLTSALRRERRETAALRARLAELETDLVFARETINGLL